MLANIMATQDQWLHLPWQLNNYKQILLLTMALQQEPCFQERYCSPQAYFWPQVEFYFYILIRIQNVSWENGMGSGQGNILTDRDSKSMIEI